MKKNITVFALCAMLHALCVSVQAQQPTKVYRVGYLSQYAGLEPRSQAFQQGLRELGYVEGKNIVIEWRFANAKTDLVTKFAKELVERREA
jgi:hypothetical protein